MALMTTSERRIAQAIADLSYSNPFLPRRIELEREALGDAFDEHEPDWNQRPDIADLHPNLIALIDLTTKLAERLREKLLKGAAPSDEEAALYQDLATFVLYHRYHEGFDRTILEAINRPSATARVALYEPFEEDAVRLLELPGLPTPDAAEYAHLFALFFQVRRAYHHIFSFILGVSQPSIRLRAAVWQSIFTHHMRRYRKLLYTRMSDFTTLVTGPSGTGKEVVARAVGLSRYIPFNPHTRNFTEDFAGSFVALNLSAMSPTLIESELFGHKRGAFTGAIADRIGWLESCPPLGTVFLDEVGELDCAIQVKLLRVLQTRKFQRLGDTKDRPFRGKIIAATNRDIAAEMHAGRFRTDFYYRLCSDLITTPALREQLADRPEELAHLTEFLTRRIVGEEEAAPIAAQIVKWIEENLGVDYAWPGNIRELEQCVRNVLIRGEYQPARPPQAEGEQQKLMADIHAGALTAEQLLRRYCKIVYGLCGSYEQSAKRLGLDRRTVKAKVEADG